MKLVTPVVSPGLRTSKCLLNVPRHILPRLLGGRVHPRGHSRLCNEVFSVKFVFIYLQVRVDEGIGLAGVLIGVELADLKRIEGEGDTIGQRERGERHDRRE